MPPAARSASHIRKSIVRRPERIVERRRSRRESIACAERLTRGLRRVPRETSARMRRCPSPAAAAALPAGHDDLVVGDVDDRRRQSAFRADACSALGRANRRVRRSRPCRSGTRSRWRWSRSPDCWRRPATSAARRRTATGKPLLEIFGRGRQVGVDHPVDLAGRVPEEDLVVLIIEVRRRHVVDRRSQTSARTAARWFRVPIGDVNSVCTLVHVPPTKS